LTQITKKALAASLKKLLLQKPLDKITIIDIVTDCGVNRQTFYYHFQDIYDLIEWLFLDEASVAVAGQKTYETWEQGFLNTFEWALENKALVLNTYRSMSREHMERYLYSMTYDLLIGVVNELAVGMPVRESDKKFIADFYKFAFVGLLLDWIRAGMKDDPKRIIEHLSILIQGDISRALNKLKVA
jgi:probable dihydroxyacetone kinase regulator